MSYIVKLNDLSYSDSLWKAWMNTVRDYEKNVLHDDDYPSVEQIVIQKKERYNFLLIEPDEKVLEFESEKDFAFFMLKWS